MSTPTEEQINHLQALYDAGTPGEWLCDAYGRVWTEDHSITDLSEDGFGPIDAESITELHNLAPALLEAAREFNKLQELRKKWGGDDYGSLTTSQHFDCYCEDQTEELSEMKEENLRLREALESFVNVADSAPPLQFIQHLGEAVRVAKEALGKETA